MDGPQFHPVLTGMVGLDSPLCRAKLALTSDCVCLCVCLFLRFDFQVCLLICLFSLYVLLLFWFCCLELEPATGYQAQGKGVVFVVWFVAHDCNYSASTVCLPFLNNELATARATTSTTTAMCLRYALHLC